MSAMDFLQLFTSYTFLTLVGSSVVIVVLCFSTGSTTKQISFIGELRTSLERAHKTCERARSAALWSAGDVGRFMGFSRFLSFPSDPQENPFVDEANRRCWQTNANHSPLLQLRLFVRP